MKRILVVDDDPVARELLSEVLQEQYSVVVACNGAEALDSMRERLPDTIVLDMMMPIMDGWTFLKAWRGDPAFAEIPVMVVSGEPQACEDGKQFGVHACLPKPFDMDSLLNAVGRLVRLTDRSDVGGPMPSAN